MEATQQRVLACPHCGELIRVPAQPPSGEAAGPVWTDGKRVPPGRPRVPEFVQCEACSDFFWLEAAHEVGRFPAASGGEGEAVDPNWLRARQAGEMSLEQYWLAIDSGFAARDSMEILLRLLAWWRSNDMIRGTEGEGEPWPARAEQNARRLLDLLNEDSSDHRLIRAEIFRRLGQFEECLNVLDSVSDPDLEEAVTKLRQLALERSRALAILWS